MGNYICLDNKDFEPYGLNQISETVFQKRNLLIGKNGAGKTRFLHARLASLKNNVSSGTVVAFLDFSSFHINGKKSVSQEEDQSSNVYDLIFNGVPVDFSNFLNIIDDGNESLVEDLFMQLNMRAPASRNQAANRLAEINKILRDLIGYAIFYDENNGAVIQRLDCQGNIIRQKNYSEMVEEFSPGERIIFDLCFFVFYLNVVKQTKLILLMDEPELHLHPQVLLKIIEWLYNSPTIEELWIASHSLFLVPLFQFQELILFDSNRIMPRNSDTYKKLYDALVGLENINVFEFLKSLDNWQYYNFLVECFCHPDAVSKVDSNDEQFKRFVAALKVDSQSVSRVLDYGAGKFRIWDCLQEAKVLGKNVSAIQYEAYEPYLSDKAKQQLDEEKVPFPLYTSASQLHQNHYDAVVLMNVLHEVDVLEWVETFHNIANILKSNGVLILLEVRTLLLGEQPYGNTGYLVLGDEEVSKLFPDVEITKCGPSKGKSNCWVIARKGVAQVSKISVKMSIDKLKNNSFEILHGLFETKLELANSNDLEYTKEISARKYAFWSQQYINAKLALERLDKDDGFLKKNSEDTVNQTKQSEKIIFPGLKDE